MSGINKSATLGLVVAVLVVFYGVIHPAKNPKIFLDLHAILIVLGGTGAAALLAYPLSQLVRLVDLFLLAILFPKKTTRLSLAKELLEFSLAYRKKTTVEYVFSNHFAAECAKLLIKKATSEEQLKKMLALRSNQFKLRYQEDAKVLTALAKFPPAFGLLGASTGMIEMMANLSAGGAKIIGGAMALALVATFWGIALANFVLLPLADHASRLSRDDSNSREMIATVLMQIRAEESIFLIRETIKSYLPPEERDEFSEAVKAGLSEPSRAVDRVS